jgi:hypothetical protein
MSNWETQVDDVSDIDPAIRRSLVGLNPSDLVRDAANAPVIRVSRGPGALSLGFAIVAIGAILAFTWLNQAPRSGVGSGGAGLSTPAGALEVRLVSSGVVVELTPTGKHASTDLAELAGGPTRPFVAQLVCSSEVGLADVTVLFGYLGPGIEAEVSGAHDGESIVDADGAFLFVGSGSLRPGNIWTVQGGSMTFSGPYAAWGVTETTQSSSEVACIGFDPSTLPYKP